MQLPANLQSTLVNVTSAGVINTQTLSTIVAAPGVAYRWRLWGMRFATLQNGAAAQWRVYAYEATTGTRRMAVEFPQPGMAVMDWSGMGGIALTTNVALQAETYCTVATQTLAVFAYYTLEAA